MKTGKNSWPIQREYIATKIRLIMYSVMFNDEGFSWLKFKMTAAKKKIKQEPHNYDLEFAIVIDGIVEAFENASKVIEETESTPKAKPKRAPKNSGIGVLKGGCTEHPTYGAKRAPRKDCSNCWDMYKMYNPTNYDRARRNFDRKNNAV